MNPSKFYFVTIGAVGDEEPYTFIREVQESVCNFSPTSNHVIVYKDSNHYVAQMWHPDIDKNEELKRCLTHINHYLINGDKNINSFMVFSKRLYIAINNKVIASYKDKIKKVKAISIDVEQSDNFMDMKDALKNSITLAPEEVLLWSTRYVYPKAP